MSLESEKSHILRTNEQMCIQKDGQTVRLDLLGQLRKLTQ